MRPIERGEVLGLADYEQVRPHFRARVVEDKSARRLHLGGFLTVLFENRDSVLLQIQEMLRTERITKEPSVLHELETYNELIPGDDELSLTLFVELVDPAARAEKLVELALLEEHVWIVVDGERVAARGPVRHQDPAARTTAVHYLKAKLPAAVVSRLKAGEARALSVLVEHPRLSARADAGPALVRALADELGG